MRKIVEQDIGRAQEWLTERYQIANMPQATQADETYLRGALTMVQALGLDYIVTDGHITILGGNSYDN